MARKRNGGVLGRLFAALALLTLAAGCSAQLPQVIPIRETPAPQPEPGATIQAAPATADVALLELPAAFRYQVVLRPAGQPDASTTFISGQRRDDAWQQTARTAAPGASPIDEELIVARDPDSGALRSYTRAITDTVWTRWPGMAFDAAYGLASPFTALRLLPLATETATPKPDADAPVGPQGATKVQALFSAEVIQRLLLAGASAVAADADTRAALESQLAAQFVPQTLTFWINAEGQIVQAAGTLLARGADNQPSPWLELSAAYSGYDDAAIVIAPPSQTSDSIAAAGPVERSASAPAEADPAAGSTLRVRVFATPGSPANDAIVTVYGAGKKTVVDEKLGPDAQFALQPGQYDVLIRAGGAEQWLRDVAVTGDALASNDVLFDFAQLTVAVILGDAMPAMDMVVFPAGEKVRFAGFASENPARFLLPAGLYDVEVAAADGSARRRVEGVEVRGGLETTQTIDLAAP